MCVLIFRKPGSKPLNKKTLRNCFDNNPDGCGLSYINVDNFGVPRLRVKKEMKFNKFYKRLRIAERENPESPFIIHFRISTGGSVDEYNCHPFWVDSDTVFAHNGTISNMYSSRVDNESDTRAFNRLVLSALEGDWKSNTGIKYMIEDYIGLSKLVVLSKDKSYAILNEQKGHWIEDVWFSNDSYKARVVYQGSYKGAKNTRTIPRRSTYSPATSVPSSNWRNSAKVMQSETEDKAKGNAEAKQLSMYPPAPKVPKVPSDSSLVDKWNKDELEADKIEKAEKERYGSVTFVLCDSCGELHEEDVMKYYDSMNLGIQAFCEVCIGYLEDCGLLSALDNITSVEYNYLLSVNQMAPSDSSDLCPEYNIGMP